VFTRSLPILSRLLGIVCPREVIADGVAFNELSLAVQNWLVDARQPLTEATPATKKLDPESATIWYHGEQGYSADQANPVAVTLNEHAILAVYLKCDTALSEPQLENKSGVPSIPKVLKRLCDNYDGRFAAAIRTPEGRKSSGGYHIRVRKA